MKEIKYFMTKHQLTVLVPPALEARYDGRHQEDHESEAPTIPPPPPGRHHDPP